MRKPYPDDLTDKEWEQIKPLLTSSTYRNAGRKPKHSRREMFNAIFYLLRTGCQWRHLPHEFPPWTAVQGQYSRWKRKGGTWFTIICVGGYEFFLVKPKTQAPV